MRASWRNRKRFPSAERTLKFSGTWPTLENFDDVRTMMQPYLHFQSAWRPISICLHDGPPHPNCPGRFLARKHTLLSVSMRESNVMKMMKISGQANGRMGICQNRTNPEVFCRGLSWLERWNFGSGNTCLRTSRQVRSCCRKIAALFRIFDQTYYCVRHRPDGMHYAV